MTTDPPPAGLPHDPSTQTPAVASPADPTIQVPGPSPEVVAAHQKLVATRPDLAAGVGIQLAFGGNPIQDKVNAEHITQSITLATNKEQHDFELKKQAAADELVRAKSDRWFEVFVLAVLLVLIVYVVQKFASTPAVLTPILTGVGGLVSGFLAGIGYGKKGK